MSTMCSPRRERKQLQGARLISHDGHGMRHSRLLHHPSGHHDRRTGSLEGSLAILTVEITIIHALLHCLDMT